MLARFVCRETYVKINIEELCYQKLRKREQLSRFV